MSDYAYQAECEMWDAIVANEPERVKRYALVRNARTRSEAEAYLPGNYRVVAELVELVEREERFNCVAPDGVTSDERLVFVIEGHDNAGWTLDDYVIPRYASGLIWAEEIDLSHPALKLIPA